MGDSFFLHNVAADVVARYGADLRDIAVVFNNQRPAHYLRKELARLLGRTFWSPRFFTIQDFLRDSTSRTELNGTAQVFLLNKLHTALQRERNPGFEESLDHFFPVAETILADFAQLDYELAPVDGVFADLAGQALIDRQFDFLTAEQQEFLVRFWSAFSYGQQSEMQSRFLQLWTMLPQLYHRFKSELANEGCQTMAGIYRDLAEEQPWTRDVTDDYRQVLFVGFNALNACETVLFKRWQDQGKALFYFDGDDYYCQDPLMEAGHFIRQNIEVHQLENALGPFPDRMRQMTPASRTSIRLYGAPGHVAQAKVLAQLLTDHPPSGSVAVILADESLLVPVLQSIPDELEVNVTMGYPMAESLTHSMIELYLESQLQFAAQPHKSRQPGQALIGYELLIDFIAHPFTGCSAADRNQLVQELALHQSPFLPVDWVQEVFAAQTKRFPGIFRRAPNVVALMESLQDLLAELLVNQQPGAIRGHIELSLIEQAIQTFRQLQSGFEGHPELSVTLAIRLIRRVLNKLTATLSGDPLSGIQIMGLLESRNLNFDQIFVLGANEGMLPGVHSSASFIPYNIRRAYRLPVIENQQALSGYLFYRLLHGFDTMHVLYNAVVDNNNSGEISRFAKQIQYESGLVVKECEIAISGTNPDEERDGAPLRQELVIPKEGVVWDRLLEFLRGSPTGERRSLSASAFALYLNSPLEFFFKYLAGIKEPPDLATNIQSNRLGTVIHRVMELIFRPFHESDAPLTPSAIQELLPRLGSLCRQVVVEEFYGDRIDRRAGRPASEITLSSQERIVLRLSEEYCRLFLLHDRQLGSDISLVELENENDYLLEFPIQVNGLSETVRLRGIIDRVDRVSGQMRIVDYKTGRDTLEVPARGRDADGHFDFDFFQTNWADSNKAFIQTMYYTFIYEQISGNCGVEPHLYSIRQMRSAGTLFQFKIPYKGLHPITGPVLEHVKADFVQFLRLKLEELFDPTVPFIHPSSATIYPSNPYAGYLTGAVDFAEERGDSPIS